MDTSTATMPKLLWLSDRPVPPVVFDAVSDRWQLQPWFAQEPLQRQLGEVEVVLASAGGDAASLARVLEMLDRGSTAAVVIMPGDADELHAVLERWQGPFLPVSADASAVEMAAVISAACRLSQVVRRLREAAPSAGDEELGEEMRIAANLQRDFLPARLPEIGPVRFSTLFSPAGFVSGDIYDVARLDETTLGFYVADAVGHGLPAALLTMFVKKALQTKRISGHSYEIIPPEVALAQLNADICEQNASGFHFCTAAYGVLEVDSMTLTYARAGHPEPVLFRPDGEVLSLNAPGGLLGVMPDETYDSRTVRLSPGDRLVLYSDGLEAVFRHDDGTKPPMTEALQPFAGVGAEEMLSDLSERVEHIRARRRLDNDDVTVLVLDVEL
ncbi:MAG: PP2C family protein-serine/threonine phosphatase [Phycisphaerae bacterium]